MKKRLFGAILIVAAVVVAYFWFYRFGPTRHLADDEWLATHTEKARWNEEQKDYQRAGSSPDLEFRGDRIGYYGDKRWFLWLVGKATSDDNFRVCGCTETALALMANQHSESWPKWMQTNQNRTQEEWVRDGFQKYGVSVHVPATASDVEPLLKLIGGKSWNFLMGGPQGTNAPDSIPDYVQYNAFRWLRDSGFRAAPWVISNRALVTSPEMAMALVKYGNWSSAFSSAQQDNLGNLAFGRKTDIGVETMLGIERPAFAKPWFNLLVWSSITLLVVVGFWFVGTRPKKL